MTRREFIKKYGLWGIMLLLIPGLIGDFRSKPKIKAMSGIFPVMWAHKPALSTAELQNTFDLLSFKSDKPDKRSRTLWLLNNGLWKKIIWLK